LITLDWAVSVDWSVGITHEKDLILSGDRQARAPGAPVLPRLKHPVLQ
jgi:hypothetical protein